MRRFGSTAVTAILVLATLDCDFGRNDQSLPEAQPWADQAVTRMRAHDCEGAVKALVALPESTRNRFWYELFVAAGTTCLARPNAAYYKDLLRTTLQKGEERSPQDASIQFQYGIVLERLGDTETAAQKFRSARRLAEKAIHDSTNLDVIRSNEAVLKNLDRNAL